MQLLLSPPLYYIQTNAQQEEPDWSMECKFIPTLPELILSLTYINYINIYWFSIYIYNWCQHANTLPNNACNYVSTTCRAKQGTTEKRKCIKKYIYKRVY